MKMKQDDFAVVKREVEKVVARLPGAAEEYRASNLPHKRYRWDVFYATRLKIGDGVGTHGDLNLYAYLNDDHIDAALRRILGDDYPQAKP